MTTIFWIPGTACDLFMSLFVLHHATDFGLRPAWAAGVRQRISPGNRDVLEKIFSFSVVPLEWISHLRAPSDAQAALDAIKRLPAVERLPVLTLTGEFFNKAGHLLEGIHRKGSHTVQERDELITLLGHGPGPASRDPDPLLEAWKKLAENGEKYLTAIQEYHEVYFAEEEARLQPILEQSLADARSQAERLEAVELVDSLSRGVRLENPEALTNLTLLPSWWIHPLAYMARPARGEVLMAFAARGGAPAGSEGMEAPESLVEALKSLGDPTRLRILRYLAGGPLSPSELARRLRLRPPTVIHHLRLLRLAGLVQVTVNEELERRYAARPEAIQTIHTSLKEFLNIDVECN